jgi:hypothetical protein
MLRLQYGDFQTEYCFHLPDSFPVRFRLECRWKSTEVSGNNPVSRRFRSVPESGIIDLGRVPYQSHDSDFTTQSKKAQSKGEKTDF